jgi:hypothetical protein
MASALQPTTPARTSRTTPRATQTPTDFTRSYGIVHAPKIEQAKSLRRNVGTEAASCLVITTP